MARHIKLHATPRLDATLSAELLGAAIRARRTQSGLRLEDAASLCGVAKQTLMKIEQGAGTAKLESVLQICHGLGIVLAIQPWPSEAEHDWQ